MQRRHNFQTFSWFADLNERKLLDLDPPYQRRSVWNQSFKDYFVDTVLLNYPAPAVFLYEDISPNGRSTFHVVDGKQRLTTLLEFTSDRFPVSEESDMTNLRGSYFSQLPDSVKREFWSYQFLIEYVPADDPKVINTIFDRINRNVAKLSAQELRHARLDGAFITTAGTLAELMEAMFPKNFPRFVDQSRRQMKDIEFVALLLLLLEEGPSNYSQDQLDGAFSDRDSDWPEKTAIEAEFRSVLQSVHDIMEAAPDTKLLYQSRFRNQADFYSLFGAVADLRRQNQLPSPAVSVSRLMQFLIDIEDVATRSGAESLRQYYDAARSASNDKGPRDTRIRIMKAVIQGATPTPSS